jgi:hypothetical protein
MPYSMKSDRTIIRAAAVAVLAGIALGVCAVVSCEAQAGKTNLEQPAASPGYVHAAKTKVSGTKELTVKEGAGRVVLDASSPKANLVDRKSK